MIDQVDHLIYAAPDLSSGIERIEAALGIRPGRGGQHPDYGTRNALLALGEETYLEIIAPDPDPPAPDRPRPFGIDALQAPFLATWVAKRTNLDRLAKDAATDGVQLGEVMEGGRCQPDGTFLSWRITDPHMPREDGLIPFFIDWGVTPHPASTAPKGAELLELRAEHPEPDRLSGLLAKLGLELPVTRGGPALIARIATAAGTVELR